MNTIDLTELIPRVHEAAKLNGWWDTPRNAAEALMLCVAELSEALEADRNGHRANLEKFNAALAENPKCLDETGMAGYTASAFRSYIKDSVSDELADAYIRLCDFAGGFGLDLAELTDNYEGLECPENFGEALLGITGIIVMGEYNREDRERATGMALAHIEALCAREGIDLAAHIDLKLAYNATRGYKHNGKAY